MSVVARFLITSIHPYTLRLYMSVHESEIITAITGRKNPDGRF
jgi:hypothetical protein